MTNPTPRDSAQLPPLRKLTEDELSTLHDNPNTSDVEQLVYDYAREALAAQAASVEPVGEIINSGGNTGSLPEHPSLVWLGSVPPVGTKLYASAPPSPASAPVLVTSVMGLDVYDTPNGEPAQAVDAVDGLREALRMGVECLRNQKSLHPEDFDELDERAVALLKAALATTKEVK